jgi:hypothetical protein
MTDAAAVAAAASSPSTTLDPGMPPVFLPNLVLDIISFFLF